jgi:hypothetical protein
MVLQSAAPDQFIMDEHSNLFITGILNNLYLFRLLIDPNKLIHERMTDYSHMHFFADSIYSISFAQMNFKLLTPGTCS